MSKEQNQQPSAQAETPVKTENDGPGKQLRIAREALGLTQQQVADRLHLRITSVQAVENDALEDGVSVTFTKGYIRLYAKLVHLNAEPLLQQYDQLHSTQREPAKLQSFSRRVSREAHDYRWNLVSIVVVLLVLGSVIVWWVDREGYFKDSGQKLSDAVDSLLSSEAQPMNTQGTEAVPMELPKDDLVKLNTGPQILEEDVAPPTATKMQSDSAEALAMDDDNLRVDDNSNELADDAFTEQNDIEESAEALVQGEMSETKRHAADIIEGEYTDAGYRVNSDGTVDLVFTFSEDCWVSVKDGNGEVMAIGVKKKGRVMEVAGIPPVEVILGAPQSVEIDFGGYKVDMDAFPSGQTAKFNLPVESE